MLEQNSMAGVKVMVLGGAGFIGSATTRSLIQHGAKVGVIDNLLHGVRSYVPAEADFIPGDILDAMSLHEAMARWRPSYVINLVGDTFIPTSYRLPQRFIDINVTGVCNVLCCCASLGVTRLVHVSTAEVYGSRTDPLTEHTELSFINTYAVTKMAGDGLCQTMAVEKNIPVVIARMFNCYGPRPTEPYVIPEIIKQLCASTNLSLGNIEAIRDFTYVDDAASALISLLYVELKPGEVVNVGSGRCYSVLDLLEEIASQLGICNYKLTIDASRLRHKDIDVIKCDNSKLIRITNWKANINLTDGLKRTIEWYRENGCRWAWEDYTSEGIAFK